MNLTSLSSYKPKKTYGVSSKYFSRKWRGNARKIEDDLAKRKKIGI